MIKNKLDLMLSEYRKNKMIISGISWIAQATIQKEMTYDVLMKMKRAGCYAIIYGVESASDKVLKTMNKKYTASFVEISSIKTGTVPVIGTV